MEKIIEERSDMEKADEVILPGFRFHPTDEELVGFYLKRKIQQKPLSIELIRQLDIYKYDPWDLPKMATTGEKEWYFYCPRDRKYRNSARPNRVTGAGFWKATGTDRPIYSSEGTKCIGLKKSLVFYKGRAAKGIKTDWMMHEFRLPSLSNTSLPKKPLEKTIPANDSWAICRIFKKTSTMAQRALSQSWVSPLPETNESDIFSVSQTMNANQFISENIPCNSHTAASLQFNYPPFDVATYTNKLNSQINDIPTSIMYSTNEMPLSSMLFNLTPSPCIDFGMPQIYNGLTVDSQMEINGHLINGHEDKKSLTAMKTHSFPFNVPLNISEEWKSNLTWDSPPCPSEMSTSFSTNKCYA